MLDILLVIIFGGIVIWLGVHIAIRLWKGDADYENTDDES